MNEQMNRIKLLRQFKCKMHLCVFLGKGPARNVRLQLS